MSLRMPLIAGNWKMFKDISEATQTAQRLAKQVETVTNRQVMIAPNAVCLASVGQALAGSRVELGAQNLHWEKEGAYTGEISADMILSAGASHVLVGHSERRQFFGDSDEIVNRKVQAAVAANLIPVLCVGETEPQRDAGQTFSILDKQLEFGLQGLFSDDLEQLIIAYEPVWAIGTGKTATSEQAQEAHAHIRQRVGSLMDDALAQSIRILYGGSVKPGNIAELMSMPDVDGALVGGASLEAETFARIVGYST